MNKNDYDVICNIINEKYKEAVQDQNIKGNGGREHIFSIQEFINNTNMSKTDLGKKLTKLDEELIDTLITDYYYIGIAQGLKQASNILLEAKYRPYMLNIGDNQKEPNLDEPESKEIE